MLKSRCVPVGCLAVIAGLTLPIHPAYAPPAGRPTAPHGFHEYRHDFRPPLEPGDVFKHDFRPPLEPGDVFKHDFHVPLDEPGDVFKHDFRLPLEPGDAKSDWGATPLGSQHFTVFDATTNPEERQALETRLQSDPIAKRIGLVDWRLAARPTPGEVGDVLDLAARSLPKLELALFLDPSRFGSAVSEIKAAWNHGPPASMPHTDYLDEFLEARRGGLLLAVGHVEGNDFVMQDALGHSMTLSIPLLLRKSLDHDVLIVPIGCKTADAGAPIGFLENIGTDAVERFLRQLPQNQPVFADLFAGLRTIGDMQVTLRDVLGQLDIEIKTEAAPEAEATRIRIKYPRPASPASPNPTPSPSFTASVLADADQLRPWWDRNWARAIRESPFTYLAASTLLFAVVRVWRRRILAKPYSVPNRYLVDSLKALSVAYLWIALPVTLLWIVVVTWPISLLVVLGIFFIIGTLTESKKAQ